MNARTPYSFGNKLRGGSQPPFFINNIDAKVVVTRLIAATNVGRGGVYE
jgi:hypothetical protein